MARDSGFFTFALQFVRDFLPFVCYTDGKANCLYTRKPQERTVLQMNIAILIDAENVLPASADLIFSHAASLGDVTHKEIYGAATALSAWVAPVLKYAIHPNLTIKAAKGKNSSDIALVIGAMDLLLTGDVNAVVIASSDSDFSALSIRLRNAGIEVIGMGTVRT